MYRRPTSILTEIQGAEYPFKVVHRRKWGFLDRYDVTDQRGRVIERGHPDVKDALAGAMSYNVGTGYTSRVRLIRTT